MSHVDRTSKYTKLVLLQNKQAKSVEKGCRAALEKIKGHIKTITYDNGKEFSRHQKIAEMLQCDIYYATPYHSWERGHNEHTNGLARQYFPKGTDFVKLTQTENSDD